MYGDVKIKRNVLVELNWTKRSIFYELKYWSFLTLKHNLDVMHIEKNVLESILNTLLMNDKSNDTTKARQDLKKLGIQSGLWLIQNKNGKYTKLQAAYSFTPGDKKNFCQFIKGVKQPDGFGSNFKHKMTDNDTNITDLKSHDCHIMMQCLLPYGLQQYFPAGIAKPIIELYLFFKQICSQTLIEDDMLKAQSKVVDIMCNLELIYPHGSFDIMIHLVIHLPLEALEGGLIRPGGYKDPGVNISSELFALAFRPTSTPISINSCIVNGVRFVVHSRDERRTTQNNGICSLGKDEEMYYGQLEEIFEFLDMSFKTVLFRVKWFYTRNIGQVKNLVIRNNITQILLNEDDHDIIHVDNSSDLTLTTSLNDLEIMALHIDGQSIDVDAPPDIIDVDEDDDMIDDEDVLPYDLADSNDEDLINVDDDNGVAMMYGDDGGDDHPPLHQLAGGYRGKGTRKPNLGGKKAGRMHTRKETRNLGLRKIIDELGPQPIRFEWKDKGTMFPLDDHSSHWANLLREIDEMLRLQGLGTYTDDQIMAMVCKGKQHGHILGAGGVLAGRGKDILDVPLQSQHESESGSGCDAGGDDDAGDNEDADEDEEDVDS
uniref:DUF4218 domain-containing protein n=1 Tax=Tanacetum cinerariifolium TaxID=118510 RepID=A0A6L2M5X2_TANCI|nr:hypothetical protein [Tanacetum cinerariifolium]